MGKETRENLKTSSIRTVPILIYSIHIDLTLDIEKSLGETNILSFNKVFNSLSRCFVYLIMFYKPFLTFIYIYIEISK